MTDVWTRLEALVDWERRARRDMRVSVDPERALLARLGNPERGIRAVHVTGSKGKGSTCALIDAGMRRAGLSVGRYASPHVERMSERVVIEGREIADAALVRALEPALAARDEIVASGSGVDPTWFDVVTAAALCAFREARIGWLVAEVGLGGRLDSTNVLDGEVCVITNVQLEHAAVLGPSRAAIAREKAGILKPGSTLVTGVARADEAGRVIDARAAELGVRVVRPDWVERGGDPSIDERNRSLADLALDELGRRGVLARDGRPLGAHVLDDDTARAARLPGRCERFSVGGIPVVLDGAHTPESVALTLRDLERDLRPRPIAILGLARDKDLGGVLKALAPRVERTVCTSVGSALHRTPEEIADRAAAAGMVAETAATPRTALERAVQASGGRGWILATGSLYLAGALRPVLNRAPPTC